MQHDGRSITDGDNKKPHCRNSYSHRQGRTKRSADIHSHLISDRSRGVRSRGFAQVLIVRRRRCGRSVGWSMDGQELVLMRDRRRFRESLARVRRDKAIPGGELCRLQVGIHLHWLARTLYTWVHPRRGYMHTMYSYTWLVRTLAAAAAAAAAALASFIRTSVRLCRPSAVRAYATLIAKRANAHVGHDVYICDLINERINRRY